MIQILAKIYLEHGGHLDVFSFAKAIVPPIADEPRWLAERGQEMLLVDRLFYPEKWVLMRLRLPNAVSRPGGVGYMVHHGGGVFASPVWVINTCVPAYAYRVAIVGFSAHPC